MDSLTFSIEEQWVNQWTDMRSVGKRMDELSRFLTGLDFDKFAQQNKALLQSALEDGHYNTATSLKDFFQEQFFEKRDRVVHYGEIDYQEAEGKLCLSLASALLSLLNAMDELRIKRMDEMHKKAQSAPPASAS